jgi:hypothetical protein
LYLHAELITAFALLSTSLVPMALQSRPPRLERPWISLPTSSVKYCKNYNGHAWSPLAQAVKVDTLSLVLPRRSPYWI